MLLLLIPYIISFLILIFISTYSFKFTERAHIRERGRLFGKYIRDNFSQNTRSLIDEYISPLILIQLLTVTDLFNGCLEGVADERLINFTTQNDSIVQTDPEPKVEMDTVETNLIEKVETIDANAVEIIQTVPNILEPITALIIAPILFNTIKKFNVTFCDDSFDGISRDGIPNNSVLHDSISNGVLHDSISNGISHDGSISNGISRDGSISNGISNDNADSKQIVKYNEKNKRSIEHIELSASVTISETGSATGSATASAMKSAMASAITSTNIPITKIPINIKSENDKLHTETTIDLSDDENENNDTDEISNQHQSDDRTNRFIETTETDKKYKFKLKPKTMALVEKRGKKIHISVRRS